MAPPKYTNSRVCLYTWPAAVTVNGTFEAYFVCRHIVFMLASETVRPNAAHAVTTCGHHAHLVLQVIAIRYPHRQHTALPTTSGPLSPSPARRLFRPVPSPFSFFRWGCTMLPVMALTLGEAFLRHAQHRCEKHVEQYWREQTPTSEHSPSSCRTHACKAMIGIGG